MNWLAHLYLARYDPAALRGALLGDFVFGSSGLERFGVIEGLEIRVHRRVDRYTDAHPEVLALRERFESGHRRYAGIALDMYFDHLLARDWTRWCDRPLEQFTAQAYEAIDARVDELPPRLQAVAAPMRERDWLGGYRHRDSVDHALVRIATRLSRHGGRLVECGEQLRGFEPVLEQAFERFFPQLITHSADARRELAGALGIEAPNAWELDRANDLRGSR